MKSVRVPFVPPAKEMFEANRRRSRGSISLARPPKRRDTDGVFRCIVSAYPDPGGLSVLQITCPQCNRSFDPTPVRNGQAACPTCHLRIHVQLPGNLPAASAPIPQRRTAANGPQAGPKWLPGAAATTQTPAVAPRGGGSALILLGAAAVGGVVIAGAVLIVVLAGSRNPAPTGAALAQGDTQPTERQPVPALPPPTQRDAKPDPMPRGDKGGVPGASPELERLIKLLKEGKEDKGAPARLRALLRLAELGPESRPAVPELLRLLRSPDEPENVREAIRLILERLAPLDAEHVPELRKVLAIAEWPPARIFVVDMLAKIGPDVRPALDLLLVAVTDRQPAVRRSAAKVLGQFGPNVRGKALEPLLRLFDDKDAEVREAATTALTKLGPPTAAEAESLKRLLADRMRSKEARLFAVWALAELGEVGGPPLADTLESDPDAVVKKAAAAALGEKKVKSPEAGKALARAIVHPEREVRAAAAKALGQIGVDATTLPGLLKALASDDLACRDAVGKALLKMTALSRDSERVRLPVEALEELRAALLSKAPEARAAAAYLIGTLGADAAPAVADLKRLLPEERNQLVQLEMICALAEIGAAARDAVPELRDLVKHADEDAVLVQRCAALALVRITGKGDQTLAYPVLARAMELKNATKPDPVEKEVHDRARKALSSGGQAASSALVDAYSATLQGASADKKAAQKAALQVLGKIGPAAKLNPDPRRDRLYQLLSSLQQKPDFGMPRLPGLNPGTEDDPVAQAAREAALEIYKKQR